MHPLCMKSDTHINAHHTCRYVQAYTHTHTLTKYTLHTDKIQTLNHHFISCRPFRPWMCDYQRPVTHHIISAPSHHMRAQDRIWSVPPVWRNSNKYRCGRTSVVLTVCVWQPLVKLLKLIKSRLAPMERQRFSRESNILKSWGILSNSKVHCIGVKAI